MEGEGGRDVAGGVGSVGVRRGGGGTSAPNASFFWGVPGSCGVGAPESGVQKSLNGGQTNSRHRPASRASTVPICARWRPRRGRQTKHGARENVKTYQPRIDNRTHGRGRNASTRHPSTTRAVYGSSQTVRVYFRSANRRRTRSPSPPGQVQPDPRTQTHIRGNVLRVFAFQNTGRSQLTLARARGSPTRNNASHFYRHVQVRGTVTMHSARRIPGMFPDKGVCQRCDPGVRSQPRT